MTNNELVKLKAIRAAQQVIKNKLHRTPVFSSTTIGQMLGLELYLKMELFQKTGSFKPRGVLNKLFHLPEEEKKKGVVSLSAGNHAQALSWAATKEGIASTIFMPAKSVRSKIEATQSYGGTVILTEGNLLEACLNYQKEHQLTLVHPFDDPYVIAGQGTVGLEILEDMDDLDAVIVSIGGGGLISGVAAAIKQSRPEIKVFGVEPIGASAMSQSLQKGAPVHLAKVDTVADGLAAPFAGKHTLAHVQNFVDELVLVHDQEIISTIPLIMERTKVMAEPAAAAAVAALLYKKIQLVPGSKVLCIICGGNIDRSALKSFL